MKFYEPAMERPPMTTSSSVQSSPKTRQAATRPAPTMDSITLSIPDAARVSGLSRSGIYRLLAAGDLEARKCGNRTLVLTASLRAYVASLPAALFRSVS